METTTLKLNLLRFLEQKGAYNPTAQVRLPGGHWADLQEFLPRSGTNQQTLEELLQQMRANWQVAALWLNGRWLAFYTPRGHQELNRLRGSDRPPPVFSSSLDESVFWLNLEEELWRLGQMELARQAASLGAQAAVLSATRSVLRVK